MSPNDDSRVAAARHAWNTKDIGKVRSVAWLAIPAISEIVQEQISRMKPFGEFIRLFLETPGTDRVGAAVVCGDMVGEKGYFQDLGFSRVDGFDISDLSLARADLSGCDFSFHPHVMDCNELSLEKSVYDLVVGHHGIHHIWSLDRLFSQIAESLKPGGLIAFYEWIGPRYLQIPWRNRVVCWLLLWRYFKRKQRVTHMGRTKGLWWLQDPPRAFDPSEACHSEVLWGSYIEHFQPLHSAQFGGLLYPMFEGLGANESLLADPALTEKINVVARLEQTLTQKGYVQPLFAFSIGKKL